MSQQPNEKSPARPLSRKRPILSETPTVHISLFVLTIFSVMYAYFYYWTNHILDGDTILEAFAFACALMGILLSHELGHYLTARYYKIEATLPFFIPAPIGIGTMGAFIRIKSLINNKAELLDVGAAGPLAGFVVSLVLLLAGISDSVVMPSGNALMEFGEPLILTAIINVTFGPIPEGYNLVISPVCFAAWFGFLVTALNLMPASQLDGGHIIYALFGKAHGVISRLLFIILVLWGIWADLLGLNLELMNLELLPTGILISVLAIYLIFAKGKSKIKKRSFLILIIAHVLLLLYFEVNAFRTIWLVWGGLLYMFGLDHPPTKEDKLDQEFENDLGRPKLDLRRKLTGLLCILIFIGTFIPTPIKINLP